MSDIYMINFRDKYIKYKTKYKKLVGGLFDDKVIDDYIKKKLENIEDSDLKEKLKTFLDKNNFSDSILKTTTKNTDDLPVIFSDPIIEIIKKFIVEPPCIQYLYFLYKYMMTKSNFYFDFENYKYNEDGVYNMLYTLRNSELLYEVNSTYILNENIILHYKNYQILNIILEQLISLVDEKDTVINNDNLHIIYQIIHNYFINLLKILYDSDNTNILIQINNLVKNIINIIFKDKIITKNKLYIMNQLYHNTSCSFNYLYLVDKDGNYQLNKKIDDNIEYFKKYYDLRKDDESDKPAQPNESEYVNLDFDDVNIVNNGKLLITEEIRINLEKLVELIFLNLLLFINLTNFF